jgi:hypothetical protein
LEFMIGKLKRLLSDLFYGSIKFGWEWRGQINSNARLTAGESRTPFFSAPK